MELNEFEAKLLLRGLDKASAPAEAQKAAEALIESLRNRGISGYDVLARFSTAKNSANPYPFESQRQKDEWEEKCRRSFQETYNKYYNPCDPNNPPPGMDPVAWRCAIERRNPTPQEAAQMAYWDAYQEWLESDGDGPPPSPPRTSPRPPRSNQQPPRQPKRTASPPEDWEHLRWEHLRPERERRERERPERERQERSRRFNDWLNKYAEPVPEVRMDSKEGWQATQMGSQVDSRAEPCPPSKQESRPSPEPEVSELNWGALNDLAKLLKKEKRRL